MKRHFYISDDLDELEDVEVELEERGISKPHIHVLSLDDCAVAEHGRLQEVEAVLRTNVVSGTKMGAMIGVCSAFAVLFIGYVSGWVQGIIWLPFVFLSIITLGFCTWEGGFIGIQKKNKRFAHFDETLKNGQHVFLVDIEPEREQLLTQIMSVHPALKFAGEGPSVPHWYIRLQEILQRFFRFNP